jgi:hypothetical protein
MSDPETTYCNARTKSGDGTPNDLEVRDPSPDHAGPGYCERKTSGGRCRSHGRDAGRPPSHGLYSARREELREKLHDALDLDTPGNLWGEVAVLRALLSDYLGRLNEVDGESIQDVTRLQAELRKTVDTINEMMVRSAPSEEEINTLITQFANILQRYVPEDDRHDALNELQSAVGDRGSAALESGR